MHLLVKYIVFCFMCLNLACSSDTYKAAIIDFPNSFHDKYESLINKAAQLNADIFMLPDISIESCADGQDNYGQILETLSHAVKTAGVYVAVQLTERCHNNDDMPSNLVFDRNGHLITEKTFRKQAYSKNTVENFTADFEVTFGIINEDDMVIRSLEEFEEIKNFLVFGSSDAKSYLFSKQFPSSWSYVSSSNIISTNGIYGGQITHLASGVVVAKLSKESDESSTLEVFPVNLSSYPGEEMSQYSVKPLDMEAALQGYTTTVCHDSFCCEFNTKTSFAGSPGAGYGLAAFSGAQPYGARAIAAHTCLLVACSGLYKRSCFNETKSNRTDTIFDYISVKGVYTKNNTAQFPIIHTSTKTAFSDNLKFTIENSKDVKHVSAQLSNAQNVIAFGIYGRDFSNDIDVHFENTNSIDFSDYISSENVQEFFDYLWIRLRVVIFIVSIYILEMM